MKRTGLLCKRPVFLFPPLFFMRGDYGKSALLIIIMSEDSFLKGAVYMTYKNTHYFLGANSAGGFYSLYDYFPDDAHDFLYVLKGGPGCGKSTFMKTIAKNMEDDGLFAEYIHCSGDPGSLDGVYFPEIGVTFVDGTAPHIIEPPFTGSAGAYINIGRFYDTDALQELLPEIAAVTLSYKACYSRAYAYLSGCGVVAGKFSSMFLTDSIAEAIEKRAAGIARREFKRAGSGGSVKKRFISAISCDGIIQYFDTIDTLAERVYVLENGLGMAPRMLGILKNHALLRGYDVIECMSPLLPENAEHIVIPQLSLAFVSHSSKTPCPLKAARRIRLDAMLDREAVRELRPRVKRIRQSYDMLMGEALANLSEAGALHDELEKIYNPHVDFDGVTELAGVFTEKLRAIRR